jgi:hypothetical protein
LDWFASMIKATANAAAGKPAQPYEDFLVIAVQQPKGASPRLQMPRN